MIDRSVSIFGIEQIGRVTTSVCVSAHFMMWLAGRVTPYQYLIAPIETLFDLHSQGSNLNRNNNRNR